MRKARRSDVNRDQANLDVTDLEKVTGGDLKQVPVHLADQWAASVRDSFREMDAPLGDTATARAAFAGAYVTASVLINASPQQRDAVAVVSQLLRWLYERGER
jgi:hypothetical protein